MKKWPWAVKEETGGLREPLPGTFVTTPQRQSSEEIFHTGIKLLHEAGNSILE